MWRLVLVVLVMLAGCGTSRANSGRQYARHVCQLIADCGALGLSTVEECVDRYLSSYDAFRANLESGTLTCAFDGARARPCLDAIDSTSCEALEEEPWSDSCPEPWPGWKCD